VAESDRELLKPGQIFAGRYRIERFLAHGGHGAVFIAEQLSTEATVAIKVLWPHLLDSNEVASRFALEAKVAGRVKSDFIVRVLDAGIDEDTRMPFLAMELLDGESLTEYVQNRGPLSAVDSVAFLVQVAQGLDKAHAYSDKSGHSLPIVHRDLKPDNVFVVLREDGQRTVKILDFGLAKVLTDSATISHGIKGTPLYMAYEQASGGAITSRTDIWALGLIAFFTLTGRPYWRSASHPGTDLWRILAEILHEPIVSPTERARELEIEPSWPAAFDAWFLRCVHRDPLERFATAGAAASELAEALLGAEWASTLPRSVLSVTLPNDTRTVPTRGTTRIRWSLYGAIALVLAAMAYVALHGTSRRNLRGLDGVSSKARAATQASAARSASAPTASANVPAPASSRPQMPAPSASARPEPSEAKRSSTDRSKPRRPKVRLSPPSASAAKRSSSAPRPASSVMSSPIYSER
jgi:serine/threonine protein kinase